MNQLLNSRMIVFTICVVVILFALGLFLKICTCELDEVSKLLKGLYKAALQELSFQGGDSGKSNIILCLFLGAIFVVVSTQSVISEVGALISGTPDTRETKALLFLALLFFFGWSLNFVRSSDEFSKKMRKR